MSSHTMDKDAMKSKTFPWKLHAMLELAEKENFDGVVSWLPDGKSFKVYDPSTFVKDIMPNFFQQSKYKSFQRQLNLWGFERITKNTGKGGYSRDEFFCRKDSDQISRIKRRKIKKPTFSKKKKVIATTEIIDIPSSKFDTEQCVQNFGSTSIVSNSCSDVSSILSDSDSERGSTTSLGMNEDLSPVPISEMIEHGSCPQTGDCLDFEGRNYFFVDEEEVVLENTRKISESNIVSPIPTKTISTLQTPSVQRASPQKITLCPSSMAGIALYRHFFSSNVSTPQIGDLRARNTWNYE